MMSRGGWAYMLLGLGLGAGAMVAYQQYSNGNIQKMINDIGNMGSKNTTSINSTAGNKSQAQNKLGNMM